MFLDSDDWLAPEAVGVLVALTVEYDAEIGACGTVWTINDVPSPGRDGQARLMSGDDFLAAGKDVMPVNPLSACAKLLRRSILTDSSFPVGRLHEDVFITHEWFHRAQRVVLTARKLHYYRQREGSITWGEATPKSKSDKANAHLVRAAALQTYGLYDAALAEYKNGLSWHLRAVAALGSSGCRASENLAEISQQRRLVTLRPTGVAQSVRLRVALRVYAISPNVAAFLYSKALSAAHVLSRRR